MNKKQIDALLAKKLKERKNEPNFNPAQYKRGWYEVGRRLSRGN